MFSWEPSDVHREVPCLMLIVYGLMLPGVCFYLVPPLCSTSEYFNTVKSFKWHLFLLRLKTTPEDLKMHMFSSSFTVNSQCVHTSASHLCLLNVGPGLVKTVGYVTKSCRRSIGVPVFKSLLIFCVSDSSHTYSLMLLETQSCAHLLFSRQTLVSLQSK